MGMARKSIGTASDEASLLAHIASESAAAGWTVYGPAGTTPAGSYWFQSPGESGYLNVTGGLAPEGALLRIQGYTSADLDTLGLVAANVSGYTNQDPTGPGTPVQSATTTTGGRAPVERKAGTDYEYRMAVDLDAIRMTVDYEDKNGLHGQFAIYIGTDEPTSDELEVQAQARVDSVAAGVIGPTLIPPVPSVQVTLDSDITAALKDTGAAPAPAFPNDPAQQRIFFQVVAQTGIPATDAFQVERSLPIVPSSLATVGGVTQFEVPLATAAGTSKLFQQGSGQRYDALRGAGDIVRLCSQPSIAIIAGSSTEARYPLNTYDQAIAAWDPNGGQRGSDPQNLLTSNENQDVESYEDPDVITLASGWYRIYLLMRSSEHEDSILVSDAETSKAFGALVGMVIVVNESQPNFSLYEVDENPNRRYCLMEKLSGAGLGLPFAFTSSDGAWGVGEGF